MLSGLLITLNILVCVSLIGVVLLQRSEGGAFGMGGGPTGLITTRGAGDLLTRTTWILFALFLALSMGLTLLSAHDRSSSSLTEALKNQQANPNALGQKAPPPPPAPTVPTVPSPTSQGSPLFAPPPAPAPAQGAPGQRPASAPLPKAMSLNPAKPANAPAKGAAKPAAAAPAAATPVIVAPPPAEAAPAPAPAAPPVKLNLTPPEPKADPNAPVTTGSP